jgi:hypothetical protein
VLENRVLRRIFVPKREEVEGGWRRLRNEEFRKFYALLSIIRVRQSRRMRWTGHVACIGELRMHTVFWLENLKRKDHWEDLSMDGKIISEWSLGKLCGKT